MSIEDLQTICLQLPGTTEDLKWDVHLCFSVHRKIYLLTTPDDFPPTATFVVPVEEVELLENSPGFSHNKQLGRYGWINMDDITLLTHAQWEHYIRQSYQLVVAKLPLKVRKQLGAV
ncbi:MmcQ/YjbR family DNA-binding protein [Hymenobacter rubidus]|uniref:MmcQ/YjbR family DNA-binding protein n=1 Tax=Hymenobacter rubidus TaxID=1441626 RepID=UPI00191E4561|nr:MmcQ/YjbR family DNA-binding protein [Hymenobacter rubidus]